MRPLDAAGLVHAVPLNEEAVVAAIRSASVVDAVRSAAASRYAAEHWDVDVMIRDTPTSCAISRRHDRAVRKGRGSVPGSTRARPERMSTAPRAPRAISTSSPLFLSIGRALAGTDENHNGHGRGSQNTR